jgi:hypothetical protein
MQVKIKNKARYSYLNTLVIKRKFIHTEQNATCRLTYIAKV